MAQPPYLVRGNDGSDYPADGATIAAWIRERRISPDQHAFIIAEHRWTRAGDLVPPLISRRALLYIAAGFFGLLASMLIIVSFMGWMSQRIHRKEVELGRAAIRREREARERQLRSDAPRAAEKIREGLRKVQEAEKRDQARADALMIELRPTVEPYLELKPEPEVLSAPLAGYRERIRATSGASRRADRSVSRSLDTTASTALELPAHGFFFFA